MARLILLLLIVGGLVAFVLQNMQPPIALTILGLQTPALPLGFWVLGAIAAGALTTLISAALVSLGRPVRRVAAKRAGSFTGEARSWKAGWANRSTADRPSPGRNEDWSNKASEEWEDWEGYEDPAEQRGNSTDVRDREDAAWAEWDGYDTRSRSSERRDDADRMSANQPPPRTDFEVKQEPATQQQSGSVYSYSYRKPAADSDRAEQDRKDRTENVYDADYRVITPPYRPEPEDSQPPPPPADDEDWGLDDDHPNQDDWEGRKR